MMDENNDKDPINKGNTGSDSAPPLRERTDSMSSTGSQRTYSQRFSLTAKQPYVVPDERLLELEDRKLLMDIAYDDLITVSWLLGITPKSTPIVDQASYYVRSVSCVPCYVLSRCLTVMTCFISNGAPGKFCNNVAITGIFFVQ